MIVTYIILQNPRERERERERERDVNPCLCEIIIFE